MNLESFTKYFTNNGSNCLILNELLNGLLLFYIYIYNVPIYMCPKITWASLSPDYTVMQIN